MPTIRIEVVSGEIQFIRKELRADELYPTDQRYNPTTGETEYTPDGGTTWVPAPEVDPRHQTNIPARTGGDASCQAAGSIAEYIKRFINLVVTLVGASATLVQGATAIVGFLKIISGSYAILFELLYETFATLASFGASTIAAAFDDTVYHEIACILTCHMDSNGQFDQARLDAAMSQIGTDIGGTAGTVTNLILTIMGFAGVNKAGTFYDTANDCDDCESCDWCYVIDFTQEAGGFSLRTAGVGSYSPGVGWTGVDYNASSRSVLSIVRSLAAEIDITSMSIVYTKSAGSGGNNVNWMDAVLGGTTQIHNTSNAFGSNQVKTTTSSVTVDGFYIDINSGESAATVTLKSLTLRGTGNNPFGADNC